MAKCTECGVTVHTRHSEVVCGECNKEFILEETKLLAKVASKDKKRRCRECNKLLPQGRYFRHTECDPAHTAEANYQSVWTGEEFGCGMAAMVRQRLSHAAFYKGGLIADSVSSEDGGES